MLTTDEGLSKITSLWPDHRSIVLFPVVIIALGLNCPIAMFIFGFDKPEVVKAGCALSAILNKEVVICLLLHRGSGPPVPPPWECNQE